MTNNPTTQNMTKQTLGNRSFINQVKYSPKYQSVAIVGTNDANVWIGFNLGTGTQSQANWVDVTGNNTSCASAPCSGYRTRSNRICRKSARRVHSGRRIQPKYADDSGHVFQVTCTADCGSFTWAR